MGCNLGTRVLATVLFQQQFQFVLYFTHSTAKKARVLVANFAVSAYQFELF